MIPENAVYNGSVETILNSAQHSRLCQQFSNEPAYQFVGLELVELSHGFCKTKTAVRPELLHHRAAVQGGIIAMIADSTAGYTALSVLSPAAYNDDMATIEFKTNYFRPAFADNLICISETSFAGGRIVFCSAKIYMDELKADKLCAEATLTFARLSFRP